MLSLEDLPVKGKRVLLRLDLNVPLNSDGTIADETRIVEALPSIQYLLQKDASIIILSHLGRPKGVDPTLSLKPIAHRLGKLLGKPVPCLDKASTNLTPGSVILLENLRFNPAEEKPSLDPHFAEQLAECGDYYVDDAFGAAHRDHSSITRICTHFPGKCAAGFLLQKEVQAFEPLLHNPKRPFYAVVGGSKISSKIGVLKALLKKVNALFIGGGMAYTFFKAQGVSIGESIHEDDQLDEARALLELSHKSQVPLFLPTDLVIADGYKEDARSQTISAQEGIPDGWQGMDIGPKTVELWSFAFKKCHTLFWNGPVGVFEMRRFAHGTESLARSIGALDAQTVVGGGDSIAAINQFHLGINFSHLSTGGGASLELLEFGTLPGIEALEKNQSAT